MASNALRPIAQAPTRISPFHRVPASPTHRVSYLFTNRPLASLRVFGYPRVRVVILPEYVKEHFLRPEDPHFYEIEVQAHDLRNLLISQFLEITEDDRCPVLFRKKGNCLLQQHPVLLPHGHVGWILMVQGIAVIGSSLLRDVIKRYYLPPVDLSVFIYADILGNAENPGGELPLCVEFVNKSEDPQERLLGEFGGEVRVPAKLENEVVDPALEPYDKAGESVPVALLYHDHESRILAIDVSQFYCQSNSPPLTE